MNQHNKLPYLASIAAAVIFGFSFLFTKSALDSLNTFQLLGLRFVTAAVFLSIFVLFGFIKLNLRLLDLKALLPVALFQPVLYFVFETVGVGLTSASESSVVISLVPIGVTLLAVVVLKERLKILQWLSVFVSVAGVVLIVLAKDNGGSSGRLVGILALVGAVVSAAFYNVLSRKVSVKYTPIETTFVMMWVGAIVFNITGMSAAVFKGDLSGYISGFLNIKIIPSILYLGVISSVGAFFLMNYSLSKIEASKSAIFLNLVPVVSIAAGVTFRGESLNLLQYTGAALALIGIWGTTRRPKKETNYSSKESPAL